MTEFDLGRILPIDKGEWNDTYSTEAGPGYEKLDKVTSGSGSYLSLVANNTAPLTDRASWFPYVDGASIDALVVALNTADGRVTQVESDIDQLAGDVEQITKSQAIQILKQQDGSLIFQGFAKPADDTPAATVNHAYFVIESGTVFGVAATEGQIIYSDGEDFHVKDYLSNRFLTDIEKYLLPGYYIAPNGTYLQSATYTVVDKFIPVLEGMELEFYRSTGIRDNYDRIAFYDNEFKIVSAPATIEGIIVCPENACYFKYYFKSSLPVLHFNVKKEILNLYVNKNELQEFNNANEQVYSTSLFHPEFSVGYFNNNGFESENVIFKKTSHIPVIPGRTYLTNALYRFKKYDIFRRELGVESITEGAITIGDGVYFIRIFFNASDEPIFKDSENVLNGIEHSTISKERHLNIKVKTPNKVQTSLSSLPDLQRIGGKVVSGEIGKKGAVYSIPFSTQGVYKVQFEIQLPSDVNNVDETIVVADLPPALGSIADGGFCIEVVKALPTADALYPKIKFNSGLRMRPTNAFSNYSSYYFPEVPLKPFYGEDAFSIRYVGDISIAENRDVQLDIDDTGIHIYHSTTDVSIIDIPFPASKSLTELAQHIIDETQEDGIYNGIIEFDQFSVHEGYSTDDIIRITDIKLVADYAGDKGWQAFPFYCHLIDYNFHKIEVVINKHGEGRRKTYMYYDGQKVMPIDSKITFTQIENYLNTLTLGHADVELKNYLYEEDVVLSSEPFLYMYMLHGVNADVSAEGPGNSSLRRLKELIDLHKKYGFAYVSIDDIRDWWNGKKELPRKCWSVIHDDMPHLTITENKTPEQTAIINKARRLYHSNGIQAAFALIEDMQTDTGIIEQINKDRFFKFVIHDYDHDVIMPNRTYDDLVEKTDLAIDTHRANHETSVDWVYYGGQFDYNTLKFLSARGMQTAWLVGPNLQNTLGCVTKAWYSTSLPRHNGDDQNDIVTIEGRLKG